MPVKVTAVRTEVLAGEPHVILTYRLPDELVGAHSDPAEAAKGKSANADPSYGGHDHQVAVHTWYSRMVLYGEDKHAALESIVAELLHQPADPDDPASWGGWPTPADRAAVKRQHAIVLPGPVRKALDSLVPDPTEDDLDWHRAALVKALPTERLTHHRGRGWTTREQELHDRHHGLDGQPGRGLAQHVEARAHKVTKLGRVTGL